jgi:pimeloyl-ACP methyl ester carboxylesterase
VLILLGEHDIYGQTTERLVARYRDARLVVIPSAGHVPWRQNRATFSEVVVTFVASETAAHEHQ